MDDILLDLVAEHDRLKSILAGLSPTQWSAPAGAPGWTVRDVVVHLARSEEGVSRSVAMPTTEWTTRDQPLDAPSGAV